MRLLTLCLVLFSISAAAPHALAITPEEGDVFNLKSTSLVHFDSSGVRTVVSCWSGLDCGPLIGSGPTALAAEYVPVFGQDGAVYYSYADQGIGIWRIGRIDLSTGNREEVLNTGDDDLGPWMLYPPASFFPSTVASIGGWGLAALVTGIFIGVQLRFRRTAKA